MNISTSVTADEQTHLLACASQGATMLRALSHQGRLLICCHLLSGEKSVTELENLLGMRQSAVSQQLARLRQDNVVKSRRDGKTIWYRLDSANARALLQAMHNIF